MALPLLNHLPCLKRLSDYELKGHSPCLIQNTWLKNSRKVMKLTEKIQLRIKASMKLSWRGENVQSRVEVLVWTDCPSWIFSVSRSYLFFFILFSYLFLFFVSLVEMKIFFEMECNSNLKLKQNDQVFR